MKSRTRILTLATVILAAIISLSAQTTQEVVSGKATTKLDRLRAGETFDIELAIQIKKGWYTYDLVERLNDEGIGPTPITIASLNEDHFIINGKIKSPKPIMAYDSGFNINVGKFKQNVRFTIPAKALKDLDFNKETLKLELYIQVCDSTSCLPPTALEFKVMSTLKRSDEDYMAALATKDTSQIDKGALAKDKTSSDLKSTKQKNQANGDAQSEALSEIERAKKEGIWAYLILAMGFGALALLTPCVFPMIPITVSFFTKRAESAKTNALADALLYALGIMATFVAIGIVVSVLFGASAIGDIASNPWVNILIASVFIVFALNLFGAFEIQVPTSILNKLNSKANAGGRSGIILMGFVFSLTSFTCTVPFVGSSLLSAADGEWFMPIIGMLGFSFIFAIPFFLLAMFPSLLKKMPKSGGWMNNIKVVMGFLEIAAALKFISNVDLVWSWELISRQIFVAIWIAIALLITFYVLGKFLLKLDSPVERIGAPRAIFAVVFLSIAIALTPGLWNEPLGEIDAFLPPREYMNEGKAGFGSTSENSKEEWIKEYEPALAEARKTGKNVFIDFTGWTCTNCRWMESNMFTKNQVNELMNKFVKAKLYTDRRKEPELTNKKIQQEKFGSIALPLYAIVKPDGKIVSQIEFTRDEIEFVKFLEKGL